MMISRFRVLNYKSIVDSGELHFEAGINVIVGKNNAGKTALLEAISQQFGTRPHLSLSTAPQAGVPPRVPSSFRAEVATDVTLIEECAARSPSYMPAAAGDMDAVASLNAASANHDRRVRVAFEGTSESLTIHAEGRDACAFGLYPVAEPLASESPDTFRGFQCLYLAGAWHRQGVPGQLTGGLDTRDLVYFKSWQAHKSRIYRFSAQRRCSALSAFGTDVELTASADNLPQVLNTMQGQNPARFSRFNALLKLVFPEVHQVSIEPANNSLLRILVWFVHPSSERSDLSTPLDECGSGLGQVLAVLAVVLATDRPRVILIDEPNSFLHPGASRKLIEILQAHPQHQYIIATHQPAGLITGMASTIHMMTRENLVSCVTRIDRSDTAQLRSVLDDVGVRTSDVFGWDQIVWVEGPTEEDCFELILTADLHRSPGTTRFLAVRATDETVGDKANLVVGIYERLSKSGGVAPKALALVLDRELRTSREIADLERMKPLRVRFIPRRMYESYLLHPAAIAAVLCAASRRYELGISPGTDDIAAELEKIGNARQSEKDPEHPGQILKDLFRRVAGAALPYDKVRHGRELTLEILKQDPLHFRELREMLLGVLGLPAPTPTPGHP